MKILAFFGKRPLRNTGLLAGLVLGLLLLATWIGFRSPYPDFNAALANTAPVQVLDRTGQPLATTFQTRWNTSDNVALYNVPEIFQQAFLVSEDKRFLSHQGMDWQARAMAVWRRVRHGDSSRGASTITEQVVRILHPRRRTIWSKWMEGWEALALENRANKADILEFYLNQVPFASNRRGIVQAARFYFGRDLSTLSLREALALVVLVRAPGRYDLYHTQVDINAAIGRLAEGLLAAGYLKPADIASLANQELKPGHDEDSVEALHFVDFVRTHATQADIGRNGSVATTLDSHLQQFIQELLETRLSAVKNKNITHAAAMVVDLRNRHILAWASVGAGCRESHNTRQGCLVDMVTVPRQPGSALKPLLYATALDKGWTAATILDDSPYSDNIGRGIHHFHNYSNTYYGKVTMRTALGNSLNIPALHAINFVTPQAYLKVLQSLQMTSLTRSADFYDEGLALGNGEVTLFEVVRAYVALASGGVAYPLEITPHGIDAEAPHRVFSAESATLIGNILSDPWARSLEFGTGSVLNLPVQTAVKTGTSTDYRDAWAMGYNSHYVVGVWMGNADYTPTDGVTGAVGPALALRGIFNELTRNEETAPLPLSPKLIPQQVCLNPQDLIKDSCASYTEYFISGTAPDGTPALPRKQRDLEVLRPVEALDIAFDPRIPAAQQAFEMQVAGVDSNQNVTWIIDEVAQKPVKGASYMWPVTRGSHKVRVSLVQENGTIQMTKDVHFSVK